MDLILVLPSPDADVKFIYNPFILKLLHSRLYYMDKIVMYHMPLITEKSHDALRHFIASERHITRIVTDILSMDRLPWSSTPSEDKESVVLDLYHVNFEYAMWRLTKLYAKRVALKPMFMCEMQLQSGVELEKQQELMSYLCKRYAHEFYFDHHDTEIKRKERVVLLFNIKMLVEGDVFGDERRARGDVLHYDGEAVMYLLYIYYLNEFIASLQALQQRNALHEFQKNAPFIHDDYIKGVTEHPKKPAPLSPNKDIQFLERKRVDLYNYLCDHVKVHCIKETPCQYNSSDSACIEEEDERLMRLHVIKHTQYLTMVAPLRQELPLSDSEYRIFMGYGNMSKLPPLKYLPLKDNERCYNAVAASILFHLRLRAHHPHKKQGEGKTGCSICNYIHVHFKVHEFNHEMRLLNYNKPGITQKLLTRKSHDRALKYNAVCIVEPFQALLFQLFYKIILMLYHTNELIQYEDRCFAKRSFLFGMIDIGALMDGIKHEAVVTHLENNMRNIVTRFDGCEGREEVRRLALDMELMTHVMVAFGTQRVRYEKHERTRQHDQSRGETLRYTEMRELMKALYIYYGRQLQWFSSSMASRLSL